MDTLNIFLKRWHPFCTALLNLTNTKFKYKTLKQNSNTELKYKSSKPPEAPKI